MGEQIGLSHSFIGDLESGRTAPSVGNLLKIANFFGVTTDVLIRDELELDEGG
jgi:transcriptional regulator with XRE-family HTH domain